MKDYDPMFDQPYDDTPQGVFILKIYMTDEDDSPVDYVAVSAKSVEEALDIVNSSIACMTIESVPNAIDEQFRGIALLGDISNLFS